MASAISGEKVALFFFEKYALEGVIRQILIDVDIDLSCQGKLKNRPTVIFRCRRYKTVFLMFL
jgi:hypothetical protein